MFDFVLRRIPDKCYAHLVFISWNYKRASSSDSPTSPIPSSTGASCGRGRYGSLAGVANRCRSYQRRCIQHLLALLVISSAFAKTYRTKLAHFAVGLPCAFQALCVLCGYLCDTASPNADGHISEVSPSLKEDYGTGFNAMFWDEVLQDNTVHLGINATRATFETFFVSAIYCYYPT